MLEIKEFRCYEAKIVESEKAGGCQKSNPEHLWLELPVAVLSSTTAAAGLFTFLYFQSENPQRMAEAIVKATTNYDDPDILAEVSRGLGEPMRGLEMAAIPEGEQLAVRGW